MEKYFNILNDFEYIDNIDLNDLEKYENQVGGSPTLIQSLLLSSVFLLGYQVIKNKKIKSLTKSDSIKDEPSSELELYEIDKESKFLFFRLIDRIHHHIHTDMQKNKFTLHQTQYIKFIDVLLDNCNKLLEIFPPNLDNGLCIYDNKRIVNETKIQNTTIEEFV